MKISTIFGEKETVEISRLLFYTVGLVGGNDRPKRRAGPEGLQPQKASRQGSRSDVLARILLF